MYKEGGQQLVIIYSIPISCHRMNKSVRLALSLSFSPLSLCSTWDTVPILNNCFHYEVGRSLRSRNHYKKVFGGSKCLVPVPPSPAGRGNGSGRHNNNLLAYSLCQSRVESRLETRERAKQASKDTSNICEGSTTSTSVPDPCAVHMQMQRRP